MWSARRDAPAEKEGKKKTGAWQWPTALTDNALISALVSAQSRTKKVLVEGDNDVLLIVAIVAAKEAASKLFAQCPID